MIYEVITTKEAEDDLRGIYEYIAFQLLAPNTAKAQINRLEERILGLEELPEQFRAYEKEPWLSRELRITPVDKYLIFYVPDKEKGLVTVVRVLHSGMNVKKQLMD